MACGLFALQHFDLSAFEPSIHCGREPLQDSEGSTYVFALDADQLVATLSEICLLDVFVNLDQIKVMTMIMTDMCSNCKQRAV